MRIAAISTKHARLPIQGPHWGDTFHHVTHIECCVIEVTTDTGLTGTGFTYTSGVGGSTLKHALDHELGPHLIGTEASPQAAWQRGWMHLRDLGGGGFTTHVLAPIDIALWDIAAKAVSLPLVGLLGQCRPRIRAYASGINLNRSLDELLDQVRNWKRLGYTAFKVKVGKPDVQEDIERLTKVREIVGRAPLMVDANQGWDVPETVRRARAYEPLDLYWIEEPLLAEDADGHGRLRPLVRTPIATGENLHTLQQWAQLMDRQGVDYVQADVCRVGGITPYLEIAALARAHGLALAPHFVMELSAQLLCCLPNGHILEDVEGGGSFTALKSLVKPMPVVDGYFTPDNSTPGHGIVFDQAYLDRHAG